MVMINTNLLRAALINVSTEETRYYLCGVYMSPDGDVVATDGHRMLWAKITEGLSPGVIIPTDALKRALRGVKDEYVEVTCSSVAGLAYTPIDGTFPDFARLVPQEHGGGGTAQYNPAYVADIGKVAKLLGDKNGYCHIAHDGENPAVVTFGEREDVLCILMPIRSTPPKLRLAKPGASDK